jgi:hypothetical protein
MAFTPRWTMTEENRDAGPAHHSADILAGGAGRSDQSTFPASRSRAAGIISSRRSSNAIVGGYKNAPRMSAFVDLEYGDD